MRRPGLVSIVMAVGLPFVVLPPAHAQDARVIAAVAPVLGIDLDSGGRPAATAATTEFTVTREVSGDTVTVTVIPR